MDLEELHWRAELAPTDIDVWLELGLASLAAEDADAVARVAAHAALRHAISLGPKSVEHCLQLGEAFDSLNDHQSARNALEIGATFEPSDPSLLARFAELAFQVDGVEGARAHVQKLISIFPQDGRGYYLQARILLAEKNEEKALEFAEKAVRLGETSVPVLEVLGDLLDRNGHTDRAIKIYQRVLEAAPDHVEAYLHHAELLVQSGRGDEAIRGIADYINRSPNLLRPRIALGDICRRLGRSEVALHFLQEALTLHPESADAHLALGLTLESMQMFEESEQLLTRGAQFEARGPDILRCLARVQLRLGRPEDAAASLSRAAATFPKDASLRRELMELMVQVDDGRPASLSGDLSVFDAPQLLETIHQARLTGRLDITVDGQVAELHCDEGLLVGGILKPVQLGPISGSTSDLGVEPSPPNETEGPRAIQSFEDLKGVIATVLKQSRGVFRFFPSAHVRRDFAVPIPPQHVMLEVFREQDEQTDVALWTGLE